MSRVVDLEAVAAAAEREWNSSPELRAEFDDKKEWFISFKRAEAQGKTRILGKSQGYSTPRRSNV